MDQGQFAAQMDQLLGQVNACQRCGLCQGRHHGVLGEGPATARIMLIGEGPGAQEDATGRPFVGAAGQLLDRMVDALGMNREDFYIANIVKCRPPGNRAPTDAEAEACLPYLRAQVRALRPPILVLMGATAIRYIMGPEYRVTRDRGRWVERKGFWMMATFHPAAILRDESKRTPTFEDLRAARDKLKQLEAAQ